MDREWTNRIVNLPWDKHVFHWCITSSSDHTNHNCCLKVTWGHSGSIKSILTHGSKTLQPAHMATIPHNVASTRIINDQYCRTLKNGQTQVKFRSKVNLRNFSISFMISCFINMNYFWFNPFDEHWSKSGNTTADDNIWCWNSCERVFKSAKYGPGRPITVHGSLVVDWTRWIGMKTGLSCRHDQEPLKGSQWLI